MDTLSDKELAFFEAQERIRHPQPKPQPIRPIRKPFTAYLPPIVEREKANVLEFA